MNKLFFFSSLVITAVAVFIFLFMTFNTTVPPILKSELKPGGDTTVSIKPLASFMLPSANLDISKKPDFFAGKALAHQPWIKAPTITDARDGLGPLYNTRTCLICHSNGGRGHMPVDDQQLMFTNFLRLSIPGSDPIHGVVAEPVYGDQLQSQSTALSHQLNIKPESSHEVAPEGYVFVHWISSEFVYPDGYKLQLRQPEIKIRNLGYGAMHPYTLMGIRNSPPIHGMGLIELIDQKDIDQLIDPTDSNQDGISGRVNVVWDFDTQQPIEGRFGLKANKASVRFQVAGALQGDMGISNPVFKEQPCTKVQINCLNAIHGVNKDGIEISEKLMTLIIDFTMSLGVPERRKPNHPLVKEGRTLFYQTACHACHQPSYKTKNDKNYPHLSNQTIWPYTDLLLHDMGEGLSDGRPDYLAQGNEWRTSPLWGVGLSESVNGSKNFLHDGRAQSVEAAIIWHGGEALKSREQFMHLTKHERHALVSFVRSL